MFSLYFVNWDCTHAFFNQPIKATQCSTLNNGVRNNEIMKRKVKKNIFN